MKAITTTTTQALTGYHGSPEPLDGIRDEGLFGGIFASESEEAAASHGEHVYEIESPRHLTDFALNYEIDDAFSVALEVADGDEGIAEAIMDADAPIPESMDVEPEDFAEASWEMQRLRGRLAARLGYTSVEMRDEHGTTYLCLPGCTLSRTR